MQLDAEDEEQPFYKPSDAPDSKASAPGQATGASGGEGETQAEVAATATVEQEE